MVAKDVWGYIATHCSPFAAVQMDGLSGDEQSISIQQGRSSPMIHAYMNGDIYGEFVFDVRAKSMDRLLANTWLQELTDHFKKRVDIPLGDQVLFTAEPVTAPYLLEREEDGGYIYAASFSVTYDEKVGG